MGYALLADVILITHFLLVVFNVGALPAIWLGHFFKWQFVRNFCFRITHLLLIAFVAAEAALGTICPLTSWEDQLRVRAGEDARYQSGYIAYWVHRIMFYDFDPKFFIIAYALFFILVLATFIWIKPLPPKWLLQRRSRRAVR
jgi:hypothetical protein